MSWARGFFLILCIQNLATTNHKSYLLSHHTMNILLVCSSKNPTASMIFMLTHNGKMAPARVQLISAKCSQ